MIIRTQKAAVQHEPNQNTTVDISGAFQAPTEYKDGSRKHLRGFHSGDWWLNVDYVTAEVAA